MKKILLAALFSSSAILNAQYDVSPSQKTDFQWPEGKQVAISLTFDDGRSSQVDQGVPLFDKYNVKATFYISPEGVKKSLDKWKKAVANGHEIGNHTFTHRCTWNYDFSRNKGLEAATLDIIREDLDSANAFIKRTFGVDPVSFAYPCGQTFVGQGTNTKSYVPLIAQYFESGRGWLGEAPNNPSICAMSQVTGMELDGKSWEQVKAIIEAARKDKKWVLLAGHDIGEGGRQVSSLSTLEEICKYAADPANGIWLDNVHNIAAWVREKRGEPFRKKPAYMDPTLSIADRVEDLLSQMTIEEKIGQINMPCVYLTKVGRDINAKTENVKKLTEGTREKGVGHASGGERF